MKTLLCPLTTSLTNPTLPPRSPQNHSTSKPQASNHLGRQHVCCGITQPSVNELSRNSNESSGADTPEQGTAGGMAGVASFDRLCSQALTK